MPYCYECKTEVEIDDVLVVCKDDKCVCIRCVARIGESEQKKLNPTALREVIQAVNAPS